MTGPGQGVARNLFALCLWLAGSSTTARTTQGVLVSDAAADAVSIRVVVTVPAETPVNSDIYLAGSLPASGGWKADGVKLARQGDGTYAATVTLEAGATLEFKFTRGSWGTVEKNADDTDRANRSVTIDANTKSITATVERWAATSSVTGTLKLHELDSAALKSKRTIRVWLPPGYEANADTHYDVLYLHDGQNCFDRATSAFGHEWEIDETLTKLIADKTIRPIIVVGIDNGGAKRIDELTFEPDPKHAGGHGAAYEAFLLDEVRPFVEKNYRVSPDAQHTFLGGSSLGGLASLEIARRHPGTFAGVIAMSPSLFWNDQALAKTIERDAAPLKGSRIWLDIGTRENNDTDSPANARTVDDARRVDAALTAGGVEHHLSIVEGARHNEEAWAKRFPDAIRYLLSN